VIFIDDLIKQLPKEYSLSDNILEYFHLKLIEEFYSFLKQNNEVGGFFSKSDTERIASRHIYESMVYIYYLIKEISVSRETSVLDIGSGPGIPGYLFYCLKEKPQITLLDSSKRRLQFIETFCKNNGYLDIKIVYSRIEEWNKIYDIAITRALIPFPFNAVLLTHSFRSNAAIFAGKTKIHDDVFQYLKKYNLTIEKNILIPELEFLGERRLILLSHIDKQKKMKPVKWKILRREMDELQYSNS
jgi:16S rRNA (guanine527-N7)-methyltransferase